MARLVLLDGSNFRVDGLDGGARSGRATDGSGVALQCAVGQRVGHALNIAGRLGVAECLISSRLLEAVGVLR